MSVIDDGPVINYKDSSIDQAQDAEFTRLRHSTTSTINFKLLKSFDNQLIWCDVSTGHNRPYITGKFRRKVFSNLHGLGHPSHRATQPLINTRFVWHGMNIDIARWCRSCKGCQTAKVSRHNTPVFGKFTEPTEPFDHVHIDIVGPLPYANGVDILGTIRPKDSGAKRKSTAFRFKLHSQVSGHLGISGGGGKLSRHAQNLLSHE